MTGCAASCLYVCIGESSPRRKESAVMVYDEAKQAAATKAVEDDVFDRLEWEIERAGRREKEVFTRIASNASSDWALVDELTDVYAQRPITRYQRWAQEQIAKGVPTWKVVDDLVERVTEDVMRWPGARSTSRGSNAIAEQAHLFLLKFRESCLSMQFKTNLIKPQD